MNTSEISIYTIPIIIIIQYIPVKPLEGITYTYTVFSTDFKVVSQNLKVANGCTVSAWRAQATRGVSGDPI